MIQTPINRTRMSRADFSARLSAYQCDGCKKQVSKYVEERLLKNYAEDCNWCGRRNYVSDVKVRILPRYQSYLWTHRVYGDEWWHATETKGWYDALRAHEQSEGLAPMVHVGSHESACALADLKHSKGKTWYINRVRIKRGAKIAGKVFDDQNYWPEDDEDIDGFEGFSEITRYVNRYEIPGSISLLADYRQIEVIETRRLTRAEVRRTLVR